MADVYLHQHKDFNDLLNIVAEEKGIDAALIEKDYWLMHVLFGLKKQGYEFKLKGGTSLSKGYEIIHRFSEDIDIYIKPPANLGINEKSEKQTQIDKRKAFYENLANEIKIEGIVSVKRDTAFDDAGKYRSGGIRLFYKSQGKPITGVKQGILLEVGFDTVNPSESLIISSWAYDQAISNSLVKIIDNRAVSIGCYSPSYTFVEKLQTIATKYRVEQESGKPNPNFMRQYYDVYCLLDHKSVRDFIGTAEYEAHKKKRFPSKDYAVPIGRNEAFLLSDLKTRSDFESRYRATSALYYKGQPPFDEVLARIHSFADML